MTFLILAFYGILYIIKVYGIGIWNYFQAQAFWIRDTDMYSLARIHRSCSSVLFHSASQLHHIQHPAHFLPFIILPKTTNQYIFTLKMATAVFACWNTASAQWGLFSKSEVTLNTIRGKRRASTTHIVYLMFVDITT